MADSVSDRTPLLVEHKELPADTTTTTTTTTATITPVIDKTPSPPQDAEDDVDGVLFNTGPLHTTTTTTSSASGRGTPNLANGMVLPPHLYGGGDSMDPLVGNRPIRVYLQRFWILGSFSFLAWFQCLMWNTWGPLSASMDAAYPGWGSGTVAMMGNWGTITFVVFVVPMCWLMNAKGLRVGVLACGGMVATGVVVRAVPLLVSTSTTFFTVMCHICAIFVGTAGTLVMAAPPMIAAVWFPPKERTTATAFCQMLNQLGNAGSYLEPLLVREPSKDPTPEELPEIRDDVQRLMYIWAGVGVVMQAVFLLYFPTKPPSPPSVTSHVERLDFKEGMKMMLRNRDLLLVTVSYGLNLGVPSAWASVLNFSLYDLGMSQNEAMWVGLAGIVTSAFASLFVGRFTDLVYGHIKLSILISISITLFFFYWFFLLSWGSIPVSRWQIYVTVIGALSFNFSLSPLFFELAVENAYPCSEVMVGGLLTACNNFVGLIFLFLFLVPAPSKQWVTYVLLTSTATSLLPLIFVKEDYSRSTIDRSHHSAYQPI